MPALAAGAAPRVGHQVLAVSPNKKKWQRSVPGGCAGSSPPACSPEHPASHWHRQRPLDSAPRSPNRAARPSLTGALLSPIPAAQRLGWWLWGNGGHAGRCSEGAGTCSEGVLEAALTSCQTGASRSPWKFPLYLKRDHQGQLLDSHAQLMAACCLLPPLF